MIRHLVTFDARALADSFESIGCWHYRAPNVYVTSQLEGKCNFNLYECPDCGGPGESDNSLFGGVRGIWCHPKKTPATGFRLPQVNIATCPGGDRHLDFYLKSDISAETSYCDK